MLLISVNATANFGSFVISSATTHGSGTCPLDDCEEKVHPQTTDKYPLLTRDSGDPIH